MIWQRVRGHNDQIEMFRRSLGRSRLAHAYLFAGSPGIGKRLFAHTLAQCLLCPNREAASLDACGECGSCRQMAAGTHSDYLTVAVPEGRSELPVDLIAGPREHRGREGLCHDLSLRPMESTRRIAVIDDADRMNAQSANALLKTLEEPPDYAVLILIAADLDVILPTIRSRCQLVRFAPLSDEIVAELLLEQGFVNEVGEAHQLAALCAGSLSAAAQLVEPQLRRLRDTLYESLARQPFDGADVSQRVLAVFDELGGDARAQRESAGWIVRLIIEFCRRAVRRLAGSPDPCELPAVTQFVEGLDSAGIGSVEPIMELLERAALAESQLEQNVSVPLCLETLFSDLGRTLRTV